ncbi:MAG: RsbRD N-terminal domain-containing protein, partial [Gemmatimonadota bacterium]
WPDPRMGRATRGQGGDAGLPAGESMFARACARRSGMMSLQAVLQERKDAIVGRWSDEVLAAYPADGGAFFKRQKDRFANPVGHTVREGTRALFDALVDGSDGAALRGPLEDMLKVRAVQQFPASTAVGFVLRLKGAVRAELGDRRGDLIHELDRFEEAVDRLALIAFDVFVDCREQLANVRIRELQRKVSWIVGQLNKRSTDPDNRIEIGQ